MKKIINTLKNIWSIDELRNRIVFTLTLLLVYRVGCHVVIPGINPNDLNNNEGQSGFLGLFLLWIVLAFIKDAANEHILSTKVALILPLGGSYMMLILVTGLIGGLISGFAALTGSFVKK